MVLISKVRKFGTGYREKMSTGSGLLPKVGNARYLDWGHGTPHWEDGYFNGIRDCDILIGFNMAFRTEILKKDFDLTNFLNSILLRSV